MVKGTAWRVICLVAGIIIALGMGSVYSFSAYSVALKQRMNYTETEINTVSALGNLGMFIGSLPIGFFLDRFGPRLTFSVATVLMFSGYFMVYEAVLSHMPRTAILVGLYYLAVSLGISASTSGIVVTNTRNWIPKHRGKVSAVLFGGFGISSAVIVQAYRTFFINNGEVNLEGFFLMLAIGLASCGVLGILFVQKVDLESEQEFKPLLADPETSDKSDSTSVGHAGLFGIVGGRGLFKQPAFYFAFIILSCTTGLGYLYINVLGSVFVSWGITEIKITTLVTILAFANLGGRLLFGGMIDFMVTKVPIAMILVIPSTLLTLSFAALAFAPHFVTLIVCTIVLVAAYGGTWPSNNYMINAYFGDKYHGGNLGVITVGGVTAAIWPIIAGKIYDAHVPANSPTHQCLGAECYQLTFILATATGLVAVTLGIVLSVIESRKRKSLIRPVIVN